MVHAQFIKKKKKTVISSSELRYRYAINEVETNRESCRVISVM